MMQCCDMNAKCRFFSVEIVDMLCLTDAVDAQVLTWLLRGCNEAVVVMSSTGALHVYHFNWYINEGCWKMIIGKSISIQRIHL